MLLASARCTGGDGCRLRDSSNGSEACCAEEAEARVRDQERASAVGELPLLNTDTLYGAERWEVGGTRGYVLAKMKRRYGASKLNAAYSRLHPLHPSERRSPCQRQRGSGYPVRVSRRDEGYVPGRQPEVHTVVQADMRNATVRVVGASRQGAGEVHGRQGDQEDVLRVHDPSRGSLLRSYGDRWRV